MLMLSFDTSRLNNLSDAYGFGAPVIANRISISTKLQYLKPVILQVKSSEHYLLAIKIFAELQVLTPGIGGQ